MKANHPFAIALKAHIEEKRIWWEEFWKKHQETIKESKPERIQELPAK